MKAIRMKRTVGLSETAFRDGVDAAISLRPLREALYGVLCRDQKYGENRLPMKTIIELSETGGEVHWDVKKAS